MIKPILVTVTFSESNLFSENKSYSVDEFEALAFKVAATEELGGAKTDILIDFDNGQQYESELCIGQSLESDKGIEKRLRQLKEYFIANEARLSATNKLEHKFLTLVDLSDIDNTENQAALFEFIKQEGIRKEEAQKKAYAEKQRKLELRRKEEAIFRESLNIPEDAKAVIVASFTSPCPSSDPYADYYASKTDNVIILAWSKHTRDLFSEMRKAALNHESTKALNNKDLSTEHREKYSMGAGYYLTNKEYIRNGIEIKKITFKYCKTDEDKARRIPMGEIAIPGYVARNVESEKDTNDENSAAEVKPALGAMKVKPIETMVHSTKGHTIFVVNLEDRVDKPMFIKLNELANSHKGYYSKFSKGDAKPGFHFRTIESAQTFCTAIAGSNAELSTPIHSNPNTNQAEEFTSEAEGAPFLQKLIDKKSEQDQTISVWVEACEAITFVNTDEPEEPVRNVKGAELIRFASCFLMDEVKRVKGVGVIRYKTAVFNVYFASNKSSYIN